MRKLLAGVSAAGLAGFLAACVTVPADPNLTPEEQQLAAALEQQKQVCTLARIGIRTARLSLPDMDPEVAVAVDRVVNVLETKCGEPVTAATYAVVLEEIDLYLAELEALRAQEGA